MARRLNYKELVAVAENILHPAEAQFAEDQISEQLLLLCINCPDPAGAMDWIVVEALPPITAQELVDRALALPPRDPPSLPESELPATHPLRHMKLEC
jgi:hypothetical protein